MMSCTYIVSLNHITLYFDKRRAIAMGIGLSGSGVGGFFAGPITALLLDTYSLRGTFLIMGGIMLNLCVAAMLFRPITFYQSTKHKLSEANIKEETLKVGIKGEPPIKGQKTKEKQRFSTMFKQIIKTPAFICICVARFSIIGAWFASIGILIPAWSQEVGLTPTQIGFVIGIFSGSDAIGRIFFGFINDLHIISTCHLSVALLSAAVILSLLVPTVGTSFIVLCTLIIPYGIFLGGTAPLISVLMYQVMERHLAMLALGLSSIMSLPQIFLQQAAGELIYMLNISVPIHKLLCKSIIYTSMFSSIPNTTPPYYL